MSMELLKELLGHPTELYNLMKFKMSAFGVSKMDLDSLSDGLRVCYKYLNEISRSFTTLIMSLDIKLSHTVCIFYLILRALDTVEDDVTISLEMRVSMLQNFHSYLYQPDWKYMDSKQKHKQVLEDFPTISGEFRKLEKVYQDVIVDICQKMGHGMAEFLGKKIDSLKDWDRYCYYVAGLVGIGLIRILSASGMEDLTSGQAIEYAKSVGIFLQKINIIQDYLEDQLDGREFWPKEVWSKYTKKLSDLAKPENTDKAVQCMNELITNTLHHVPDVLSCLSQMKNQNNVKIVAISQVMAVATLATLYNNKQVFRHKVKIRKGEAVTLMMKATNMEAAKNIIYHYMEEIYQKIPSTDPSSSKTKQIVSSVLSMNKPSSGFISQNNNLLIFLFCIMLLMAFWWQYLNTI